MKQLLAIFFILFLAAAVFGFAGMNHGIHSNMANGCVASVLGSSICVHDAVGMAMHYISTYQSFSQAEINYFSVSALLLLLSILAAGVILLRRQPSNGLKYFLPLGFLRLQFQTIGRNANHKVLSWLSLFENSPSFSS